MRVLGAMAIGLLWAASTGCEYYHRVWQLEPKDQTSPRYFTVPEHDDPRAAATYTTLVPDALCTPEKAPRAEQPVCVETSKCTISTAAVCSGAGVELRYFQVRVSRDEVSVHVDRGSCPIPLQAMRKEIDAAIAAAKCRKDAQLGMAALVRKQLPRSFDEALRDEVGFGPATAANATPRYFEVLAGMRLRVERSSLLPADELARTAMTAPGDTSYITVSRATPSAQARAGALVFDAALARMKLAVDGVEARYATAPVDLSDETRKAPYWYVLYPPLFISAEQPATREADHLVVMIGGDDRARLEELATASNRKVCIGIVCDGLADSPAKPCKVDVSALKCVRFPGRTIVVPEIHIFLKGNLQYISAGSRLGDVLTGHVGDRAVALSHYVIKLERWYHGRYVKVALPAAWSEVPVLTGDRVSW